MRERGQRWWFFVFLLSVALACSSNGQGPADAPSGLTQQPPPPPALPGLRILAFPEPIFGGQYSVLRVGPLRAPAPSVALDPHDGHGPLQLPPLLLVHGLARWGMADYFPLLAELSQDREVVVVDLPGFGRSTRTNQEYNPNNYARFLAHVIETQLGSVVDVAGHSMGGAVSIALAGQYPNKVRRLAVIDAAGILFRESLVFEMQNAPMDEPEVNVLRLVGRDLWRAALGLTSPFFDPKVVLANRLLRQQMLNGDPMQIAALSLLEHNFDSDLSTVTSNALLVWGDQDMTAPLRTFHVLRERLPVWESNLLPGIGHNPMTEAPAKLTQLLLRFFRRTTIGYTGVKAARIVDHPKGDMRGPTGGTLRGVLRRARHHSMPRGDDPQCGDSVTRGAQLERRAAQCYD